MSKCKKITGICLLLCMLLSLFGCGNTTKAVNDKDVVILYTNDVHCGVSDNIGYAGLSYLKNQLQADNYVGLVDCGDSIQGDFIGTVGNGKYIISLMNDLGYEIAIPGNHEFDYGVESFLDLTNEASFPYICCNFSYTSTGESVFSGYKVLEYGSIKVGYVGVLTPKTIKCSSPILFCDEEGNYLYDFATGNDGQVLYDAVQNAVDSAKKEGADYIVALSHLGDIDDADHYCSLDVIANTTGIDVMLDAHSHSIVECERVKNADGEFVLLSQTGTKLQNVGMLVITKSGNISTGLISSVEGTDETIAAEIETIEADYQEHLNAVVAHSDYDLSIYENEQRIVRNSESSLGNLIADAFRYYGDADIGIQNGGSIRDSIEQGDITYGKLYTVEPFNNSVCVIEATGAQIRDAIEIGVVNYPAESGGFLHVSGLTYEIDSGIPSSVTYDENGMCEPITGEYRVKNIKVNGSDLELDKIYTVAGTNYTLLEQGDSRTVFDNCNVLQNEGYLAVDVILDYITNVLGGNIGSEYANNRGEGRIIAY